MTLSSDSYLITLNDLIYNRSFI